MEIRDFFILSTDFDNILLLGAFAGFIAALIYFRKKKEKKSTIMKKTTPVPKIDFSKRKFIKTLGSLGLAGIVFSLLTKKAQALSFGGTGVPDPIGVEPLGNSQTTGSVTLTSADTWYQTPSSNQSDRVFLAMQNRSGHDMYWSFDNGVSSSTGGLLLPDGGTLQLDAGNSVNVYIRCGTAGQTIWYAESQSQ